MITSAGNVTPKASRTMLRYCASEISERRAGASDAPGAQAAGGVVPAPPPAPAVASPAVPPFEGAPVGGSSREIRPVQAPTSSIRTRSVAPERGRAQPLRRMLGLDAHRRVGRQA